MGDATVGSWVDPADIRPRSIQLVGGLKPNRINCFPGMFCKVEEHSLQYLIT